MYTKKNKYFFTIVCACYNVDKWIQVFFSSFIKQTLCFTECIQLILVDDGSTDNTSALAKEFAAQYQNNVLYLHKENGGPSSARNY